MSNDLLTPAGPKAHLGGYIHCGDPDTYYPELWQWLTQTFNIHSVLDVGCGEGYSAKFFRGLGCQVMGVDGAMEAKANSVIPDCHMVHDFVTGPFVPQREFDCVWSCEFVEHVSPEHVPHILETFKSSKRYIVMTHAQPGQGGHHHVNCQPDSYWIQKLDDIGFVPSFPLTVRAREIAGHGYFRLSGLVFVKRPWTTRWFPAFLNAGLYRARWRLLKGQRHMVRAWSYYKRHGLRETLRKSWQEMRRAAER